VEGATGVGYSAVLFLVISADSATDSEIQDSYLHPNGRKDMANERITSKSIGFGQIDFPTRALRSF